MSENGGLVGVTSLFVLTRPLHFRFNKVMDDVRDRRWDDECSWINFVYKGPNLLPLPWNPRTHKEVLQRSTETFE